VRIAETTESQNRKPDPALFSYHAYSTEIIYSALGGMTKEKFGTDTALYNKLFYNSRGQLAEIREGTSYTGPNDTGAERGAIINFYGTCWGMCGGQNSTAAMPENNGNLRRQEIYIPSGPMFAQTFDYDTLNRLQRVTEGSSWQREYVYDRYGNRTIHQTNTWGPTTGPLIPKPNFELQTNTNRLYAPGDLALSEIQRVMQYDAAGNLKKDKDINGAAVTRVYDGENRMTSETRADTSVAGSYSYNADGQRVRRNVNGVETWQVYGMEGELLAEYAANTAAASPQKEYGYRNGQLLITATLAAAGWGAPPSFSPPALLVSGGDIKLEHLTELRTAVNQLRSHAGLAAASFTVDPSPERYVTTVKADHILQLRTALEGARLQLGLSTGGYAHPGLHSTDFIFAIDFQELRDQVLSAWNSGGTAGGIEWLVADQLGTPRMVFDQTGALATTKRHDYLPFGEDLVAGSRATTPGYGAADGVRQKFTGYERDGETKLDFAQARYVSNVQGRFTGPDPFMLSADPWQPQSMNRYTYVLNNPLNNTDPLGLYYVGNGAKDPFIKEFKQDPEKGDFPEWDPKDTIIIIIRADKNTGRRISEDEASAISIRNMVVGMSLADEFDQKAAQAQPSGPYFHAAADSTGTAELTWEFFSGRGERHRYFGPSAAMTRNMMTSPDVAAHRQRFIQQGGGMYGPTSVKFGWSAQDGPYTAAKSGPIENGPRQFVGSFTITIREGSNGDALFTLRNTTSLRSLLLDFPAVENVQRTDMLPLSNKTQEFWWYEKGLIKH